MVQYPKDSFGMGPLGLKEQGEGALPVSREGSEWSCTLNKIRAFSRGSHGNLARKGPGTGIPTSVFPYPLIFRLAEPSRKPEEKQVYQCK